MNYGYARVSTTAQDLKAQKQSLLDAGVDERLIYSDKFSGTTTNRPQFKQLMNKLKQGDTITVTKLDRLARNTREALEVIESLLEQDVNINVLNMGKIENTTVGRLIYTILSAVAEMERDMIVERTQEGKAYAKKHNPNYFEGRPKRKLNKKYLLAIDLLKQNSYKETAELTGMSISTLQRIKKQYIAETGDKF